MLIHMGCVDVLGYFEVHEPLSRILPPNCTSDVRKAGLPSLSLQPACQQGVILKFS